MFTNFELKIIRTALCNYNGPYKDGSALHGWEEEYKDKCINKSKYLIERIEEFLEEAHDINRRISQASHTCDDSATY